MIIVFRIYLTHDDVNKTPRNFRITRFSGGNLVCKYALGTSVTAMSLFSYASIINIVMIVSNDTVGDVKDFPSLVYLHCRDLFVHMHPLILPHLFCAIRFTTSRDSLLSLSVSLLNGIDSMTGFPGTTLSFSCFNS